MTPYNYKTKAGEVVEFDLDLVTDVALGFSAMRPTWTATLVYVPASDTFVELRSSPQDYRGDSSEESEEVDLDYIGNAFGISAEQAGLVRSSPANWRVINMRVRA